MITNDLHGDRPPGTPTGHGWKRPVVGLTIAAVTAATAGVIGAGTASAAVPDFPDNILVFPDRDFVSIEGYQDHIGQKATVTVTRGVQIVGQSEGTVAAGDVAFEINHPGGYCWGVNAGPSLQVTPDIVKGDQIALRFSDGTTADTTVGSGVASDAVQSGTTVTVTGTIGPDVNPDFIEQRIVNPDLVPLIGKRSVAAVPGPVVPSGKAPYSSGLTVDPPATDGSRTVTATYKFDGTDAQVNADAAHAAANSSLGERLMSWQVQDNAGNRQGLTIAEFGEAGGPGIGGCPQGPSNSTPSAGSVLVTPSSDKTSATLDWTPSVAANGAAPLAGYSVLAIGPSDGGSTAQRVQTGLRFNDAARTATITGLDATKAYAFEVRSIDANGVESAPFTVGINNGPAPAQTPGVAPTLTVTPPPDPDPTVVVVTSSPVSAASSTGAQIWYSVDSPVYAGGSLTGSAQPYTGPIPVTAQTTLHFAALNASDNVETVTGTYKPAAAKPAVPTGVTATGGQLSATVKWQPVDGATSYQVTVYNQTASGPTRAASQPAASTASPATISNLQPGSYVFAVAAVNAQGSSAESATSTAVVVTGVVDTLTATGTWKSGDFRVRGTSTATSGDITVHSGSYDGPVIPGMTGALAPAVAPATGTTFDIRTTKTAAPTVSPKTIYLTSSNGGRTTITVTG